MPSESSAGAATRARRDGGRAVGPDPDRSVADECSRLEAAIASTRKQIASATFRAESRDAAARAALQTELMATRSKILEREQRHRDAIAGLRTTARFEATQIIDRARRLAKRAGSITEDGHGG